MDPLNIQFFYGLGFALGRIQTLALSNEKLNSGRWSNTLESAVEWTKACSSFQEGILTDAVDRFKEKAATNTGKHSDVK